MEIILSQRERVVQKVNPMGVLPLDIQTHTRLLQKYNGDIKKKKKKKKRTKAKLRRSYATCMLFYMQV